jgi:hypothetical protein
MTSIRNRNPGRGFRLTLLLAGAVALSACAVESPAYYRHGPAYGQEGRIDGFITAEGRCPTIRDHETNDVFALTGSVRALRPGDHVALSERSVDGRGCGGAPTLEVLSIDVIWRGDDHGDTWFDASRDGGDLNGFLFANRDRRGWYSERYAYINGGSGGNGGGPGPGPGPGRPGSYDRDRDAPPPPPDRENPPDSRYDDRSAPPPAPPEMDNPPSEDRDNRDIRDNDNDNDNGEDEQEELSVTGRLDLGGSCPAIHTPNGDNWDLTGDLGDHRDGDRVRILGVAAGSSACGGRALRIEEVQEPPR